MDANQKCQGKHSVYFTLRIYLWFENNATFVKIMSIDLKQFYFGFTMASFVDGRGKWEKSTDISEVADNSSLPWIPLTCKLIKI